MGGRDPKSTQKRRQADAPAPAAPKAPAGGVGDLLALDDVEPQSAAAPAAQQSGDSLLIPDSVPRLEVHCMACAFDHVFDQRKRA